MSARYEPDGGVRDVRLGPPIAYCMDCEWRDHTDDCARTARRHSRAVGHSVVVERPQMRILHPPQKVQAARRRA